MPLHHFCYDGRNAVLLSVQSQGMFASTVVCHRGHGRLLYGLCFLPCRGEDVTPGSEALHKGYTHVFMITFPDAASRDAYLLDDNHTLVADKLRKVSDDFLVLVTNHSVEISAYHQ